MFVTKLNFEAALSRLVTEANRTKALSFDQETTCLNYWDTPWYDGAGIKPRVFAAQFATDKEEFYFDWHYSPDKLTDKHFLILQRELLANPDLLFFIANAPFDINHAANHEMEIKGTIHCTKQAARVVNNLEESLSLDFLGEKYLGAGKALDMAVLCKEKGFVTRIKKFGYNDKHEEVLHFDRIDVSTMAEYGKIDVRRCFDLGVFQVKKVLEIDQTIFEKLPGKQRLQDVLQNEYKLTKLFAKMGREGILIDRAYTEEAYEHEVKAYRDIEETLNVLAGKQVDWNSAKQLKPIFDAANEPYGYTEKGNACFDKDALEDSDSLLAKNILKYRHHYKRAHTYFENYIWLADRNNVLHADAQQAGTKSGRISYWSPNLANIPKRGDKDEAKYKVRRCFIPRPGTAFVDIDYTGAEYYMSMDYSREMPIVEELKAGVDPHTRLAQELNIATRDAAKTMQFRILYGGGGMAIGRALGYKGAEANRIGLSKRKAYFDRVPRLAETMRAVKYIAETRGFVFNWFGRILKADRQTSYKSFNDLIQGGVGDMTKVAMTKIDETVLPGMQTQMLIQVYDALLFQVPLTELHLVPKLISAMEGVYPHKVLPMKADAAYSDISWAHLQDSLPSIS